MLIKSKIILVNFFRNIIASLVNIAPLFIKNMAVELKEGRFLKTIIEQNELFILGHPLRKTLNINIQKKTILFYPQFPRYGFVIYKICKILNMRLTNDFRKESDLIIHWNCTTFPQRDAVLTNLQYNHKIINYMLTNISKENVANIFENVFGYKLNIDPLAFKGLCVRKSLYNSTHDGKIINCPIDKKEQGHIYQILVDNQFNSEYVCDLRVPIFQNIIPAVSLVFRSVKNRFRNVEKKDFVKTESIFSNDEISKILTFCKKIGMDYGELDILRDNNSRKIYIVDANNTPWGPSHFVNKRTKDNYLLCLTRAFYNSFLMSQT